jgi:hypothetical protein
MTSISKLPAPSSPPPSLSSGEVRLYYDDNWQSKYYSIRTNDYLNNARHSISGMFIQDEATFVAFNLPVGTVMTLTANVTSVAPGQKVWDLSGCGRCVDLVGTGQTEGVDLSKLNMNDCVSDFFWRKVDMALGAIELYQDVDFGGNRNVIFLSEWESGVVHSISSWWLQDSVSSVRWTSLNDRQIVSLFDNADGSGIPFDNIKGWGEKEINNLKDVGFNDCMSSFQWNGLVPKKEIINPFTLPVSLDTSNSVSLQSKSSGTNNSTLPQSQQLKLTDSESQTLTVTTTETEVVGYNVSYTQTWSLGEKDVASAGGSLTVGLSYSYTNTNTTTNSLTKTVSLDVTETVNVPPMCNWNGVLSVQIGKLPPTSYTTTAERWYDQPVTNSVIDPANNNWYKRTETLNGTVAGGLACNTNVQLDTSPLT